MKLVNKELNKRINAILYFCHNVEYPFKLKIFKLLYFLDFIHFKQAGRPVTDLEYLAFDKGPVPIKFHNEIKENKFPDELKKCLVIFSEKDEFTGADKFTRFIPKVKYNLKVFTEREQEILENLVLMFKEAKAEDMSEISHLKNQPWDKTKKDKGLYQKIDFFLALDEGALISKDVAEERYNTLKEIKGLFS